MTWIGPTPEQQIDRHLQDDFDQFRRKISLQILSGVVMKTPVDTGRARGNWQTAVGAPPQDTEKTTDKGGGATVESGSVTIGGSPVYGQLWVVNNLPYIVTLEHGSSKQAPYGMVETTLTSVERQFG